jgi:hypothetical protein
VLSDRCAASPIRVRKAPEPATRLVRAVDSSEPIQVGIPCPALAGKERDRLIWWHHLDGNGALGAVMELGRADQLHLAIAVQAVVVGVRLVRPIGTSSPGVAAQHRERV